MTKLRKLWHGKTRSTKIQDFNKEGGGGGYSGFQVTGMFFSNGAKSQDPKKSLGLPAINPKKIPGPKINPHKIPCQVCGP